MKHTVYVTAFWNTMTRFEVIQKTEEKAHMDETRTERDTLVISSSFSWAKSASGIHWYCTFCLLKLLVMLCLRAIIGQQWRSAIPSPAICINSPVSEGQRQGWAFAVFITATLHSKKAVIEKNYFLANVWHTEKSMWRIYFPADRHCRYIFSPLSFSLLSLPTPKMIGFAKLENEKGHSTSVDKFLCNCGVTIETVFIFVNFLFKDTA